MLRSGGFVNGSGEERVRLIIEIPLAMRSFLFAKVSLVLGVGKGVMGGGGRLHAGGGSTGRRLRAPSRTARSGGKGSRRGLLRRNGGKTLGLGGLWYLGG